MVKTRPTLTLLAILLGALCLEMPHMSARENEQKLLHKISNRVKRNLEVDEEILHAVKRKKCCKPSPITKAGYITQSGEYCLNNDIFGTIIIQANDVTLDLNSHKIDASGADFAILAQGITGLTIKDGSIINSHAAGINIVACEEVEVTAITFRQNSETSLNIQAAYVAAAPDFTVTMPSQGIWVSECDISQGNRAIVVTGSNEVQIEKSYVYENVNTTPNAVVDIEFCNDVLLEELFVNNNVKNVTVPATGNFPAFSQGMGPFGFAGLEVNVLLVAASTNVEIKNCTTNGNTSPLNGAILRPMNGLGAYGFVIDLNTVQLFFPLPSDNLVIEGHQANGNTNTTGSLIGAALYLVPNPVISNSQTNDNVTTEAQNGIGQFGTQDFLAGLVLIAPGAHVKNHQANSNISFGSETFGILSTHFAGVRSDGLMVEDSMMNFNGDIDGSTTAGGLVLTVGFQVTPSSGVIVKNCQANGNRAHSSVHGMFSQFNDALFEECQANDNSCFGAPDPANNAAFGGASGIEIVTASNCTIRSSEFSNNKTINNTAAGINAQGLVPLVPGAQPILDIFGPINLVIQDCVTNGNTSTNGFGFGIHLDKGVLTSQVVDSTAISNQVGFSDNVSATMTASIAPGGPVSVTGSIVPNASFTGGILTVTVTSGDLFAGQTLSGGGVVPGTTITSFISGTPGGVGVYGVTIPQIAAGPFTATTSSGVLHVTSVTTGDLFVGQVITGSSVAAGTTIIGYITGNGGTGDYVVSISQTVPSESMAATAPKNSFFGNRAENNSTLAYSSEIPQGPTSNVVTFTKSTAAFSGPGVTPPNRWSNIQIVP